MLGCGRPTIYELLKFANNKLEEIYKNENVGDDSGESIGDNNSSCSSNSNSQVIHKSHPLAYHKSRILDDDITKSKILINTSNNSSLYGLDMSTQLP